jgi:hypothetical protein
VRPALVALALSAAAAGGPTPTTAPTPSATAVTAVTALTGITAIPSSASSPPALEPPTSSALTSPPEPAWQESIERPHTTIARDLLVLPASTASTTIGSGASALARAPELPADYRVDTRGGLRIAYHPSQTDAAARVVPQVEAARERLSALVGQRVLERLEIRIARTSDELVALAPRGAPPAPGADLAVYGALHLIAISVQGDGESPGLEARARHALAHVALYDAVDGHPLPRWLDEGFAIEATGERRWRRGATLVRAQLEGTTLTLAQLESFPDEPSTVALADAEVADLVRALSSDGDPARLTAFTALLGRLRTGEPFARALSATYGAELPALEARWREELAHRYLAIPLAGAGAVLLSALATVVLVAWRRRRRRLEAELAEARLAAETARLLSPDAPRGKAPKLIVVDEGRGHVVYLVPSRAVPKIMHDGKTHTLH